MESDKLKSLDCFLRSDAAQVVYVAGGNEIYFPIRQEKIFDAQYFNSTRLLIVNIAGEEESITYRQDGGKSTGAEADMLNKLFQSGQK